MPNIKIEIDPNLASTASNFSTLVYQPVNSTPGAWSGYIDATMTPATQGGQGFYLTGRQAPPRGARRPPPARSRRSSSA